MKHVSLMSRSAVHCNQNTKCILLKTLVVWGSYSTVKVLQMTQHFYRQQTKLRKGNVFTTVCQEFCPRGVYTSLWADTSLARHIPMQTSPWPDTPGADTSLARHPLAIYSSLGRHPHSPPPARWLLQQTVRILLECILVFYYFKVVLVKFYK